MFTTLGLQNLLLFVFLYLQFPTALLVKGTFDDDVSTTDSSSISVTETELPEITIRPDDNTDTVSPSFVLGNLNASGPSYTVQELGNVILKYKENDTCAFDQIYDLELQDCRKKCENDQQFYGKLNVCVANKDYKKISNRPLCRNITFLSRKELEESVPEETLVQYEKTNLFGTENVSSYSGNVTFCYPYSLQFMTCVRWSLFVDEYEILDNGLNLWVSMYNQKYSTGDFLIDSSSPDREAYVCKKQKEVTDNDSTNIPAIKTAYNVGCCLSAISLLATAFIFFIENKWKYHTKVLFCHILVLFVFYTTLVLRNLCIKPHTTLCILSGVFIHLTFITAFCWMNVLAFDLWKNLSAVKMASSSTVVCLVSSIYACGLPLIITCSAVAVNYLTSPQDIFNPQYSVWCWPSKKNHASLLFLYGPSAIILAANLVFFVLTVLKLRSIGQDASAVNANVRKQLFKTYIKLMIVMGVCWCMEIVSSFDETNDWYWFFPDMINCLQGFFIFLIYFCKPNVYRAIRLFAEKQLNWLGKRIPSENLRESRSISVTELPNSASFIIRSIINESCAQKDTAAPKDAKEGSDSKSNSSEPVVR